MYFSWRIRARLIVNKALNKCCINKYMELYSSTIIYPKSEFSAAFQNYLPVGH